MPPWQIAGNAPLRWIPIQPGYPLAPSTRQGDAVFGPDPVPPLGTWTVQAVNLIGSLWLPCYVAFSVLFFGRRLHFNGPLKPDVTLGDWYWWLECSLSWTKI